MGLLKGQVLTPKWTTAQISDANDNVWFVPIKHTVGDKFLCEIDNNYYAFTLKGKRVLTNKSKTGLGKYFQLIQFDTSNTHCLKPTTKELEIMLKENSLGKLDRQKFDILSILSQREKPNFGKWSVGKKDFDTEQEARRYLDSLEEKFFIQQDENGKDEKVFLEVKHNVHSIEDLHRIFEAKEGEFPEQVKEIKRYLDSLDEKFVVQQDENGKDEKVFLEVKHNVHSIEDLHRIFEAKKGEFPEQVKEIKRYLDSLDIRHIVTPLRNITDFIHKDLVAEDSSFLGEGMARAQRLDGTLRAVTNVPVKPKGNMMMYMVVGLIIGIGALGVYALSESGALDSVFEFTDNLGTIQEGFKGLPAPGQIQTGGAGADYSDANIQTAYPDCASLEDAINTGIVDYNKLSSNMKTLVDAC